MNRLLLIQLGHILYQSYHSLFILCVVDHLIPQSEDIVGLLEFVLVVVHFVDEVFQLFVGL
jgi:hypothetical protein